MCLSSVYRNERSRGDLPAGDAVRIETAGGVTIAQVSA